MSYLKLFFFFLKQRNLLKASKHKTHENLPQRKQLQKRVSYICGKHSENSSHKDNKLQQEKPHQRHKTENVPLQKTGIKKGGQGLKLVR